MFERVQSVLRNAKELRPGSLIPHRISEIRHGSPAQRAHKLQVGDRLEGVNGRSIVGMSHGEIAQLFRQAGTKIRLRILPRIGDPGAASVTEAAEVEIDSSQIPHRMQRSVAPKPQVGDQLMEINGRSTSRMKHSDAVELIRCSGATVRLQLRRGNGFIPDHDSEHSHSSSTEVLREVREPDSMADPSSGHRGWETGSPEEKGQSSSSVGIDKREAPLQCGSAGRQGGKHESSPVRTAAGSPCRSQREGERGREQGKLHQKSVSPAWNEEALLGALTNQAEHHRKSACPLHGEEMLAGTLMSGQRGGIPAVTLEPWLQPALVPGPWLVPSRERLHQALRSSHVPG
ncbi:PDZ domain-containing protein MAGIX isoform X2 [Rhinatrema bivittatum]|uniref:PDZ domain-containing protein MAGIX isoform X2 n=1 Tax=Rhinatrema bivittatum TaxID=194408 RepID=UPI00112AFBE9|nr:PDZ domain-containing protein MAGIX isoform X2 [Rhinatrema bivittatum]